MLPLQLKELEIQLKGSAPSEYLEEKVHARNYRQQLASLVRSFSRFCVALNAWNAYLSLSDIRLAIKNMERTVKRIVGEINC